MGYKPYGYLLRGRLVIPSFSTIKPHTPIACSDMLGMSVIGQGGGRVDAGFAAYPEDNAKI